MDEILGLHGHVPLQIVSCLGSRCSKNLFPLHELPPNGTHGLPSGELT